MLDKETKLDIAKMAKLMLDCNVQLHLSQEILRQELEKEALSRTNGNRTKAAQLLGIHRNTLHRDEHRTRYIDVA